MECLVDDSVNSNLCPGCERDPPTTLVSTTCELHCPNCRESVTSSAVDNSPTIQTHRDIISPSSNTTRPRCCSCLENSAASPSPGPTPELCIPRPRSISSPSQHSNQDHSPASEPDTLVSSSCHNSPSSNSRDTPPNFRATPTQQYSEDNPQQPPVPPNQPSNKSQDRLCTSGDTRDTNQRSCLTCGGVILTGNIDLDLSDSSPAPTNINTHQHPPHNLDTSSNDLSPTDTNPSHDDAQKDTPVASNNSGASSLKTEGDVVHNSSSRQFQDVPSSAISTPGAAVLNPDTPLLTSSQIISHNMKVNRLTTARTGRASYATKSYSRTPVGAGPARPASRSYHATGEVPRIVTPDSPMGGLPAEMLYELHGLGHENEDLSADVVYSLHFRDYQIHELLGKGISSTVRRVTEKSTGTEFAVKIIDISGEKVELAQVEQVKRDTGREIKILRMCAGHSNIIELHDVFETPTFIFLVFEICRKGELFDYLTSVVSLSEKRTRIFMRQLIEAVAFIHDKDIVHRDLKPENILLDDDLNIKVSDFGFATVIEPGEELTELCGTPGYLAPEVLAHSMYENVSGYSKEVDMWACGVIMFTLLCGAPPFWNRRQMMMLRAIMNADYTFNSPEWDDITEAPKNLIQKLLVVNPKDRLTAKEALQHPFFHSQVPGEEKKFKAHRKFRAAVTCVIFYLRLNFVYKNPPPISVDIIKDNPYCVKVMRKVIDTCAFSMYKHWVKRVDNQNRAALFEHTLRDDWKHNPMTVDGIPMVVDGIK